MIQHVWERSQSAAGVDRVIVATEDKRIQQACAEFGAECALTSARCRSGTDRVAEVVRKHLQGFSHVINVQGDEPLIDPGTIDLLAGTLKAERKLQMITSASHFAPNEDVHNPNAVKVVIDRESNALYFSRSCIPFVRQETKGLRFLRHQGIYGYTTGLVDAFVRWKPTLLERAESLEQLRALENGVKIRVVQVKHLSVGVDTPDDARAVAPMLEALLKRRGGKKKQPND